MRLNEIENSRQGVYRIDAKLPLTTAKENRQRTQKERLHSASAFDSFSGIQLAFRALVELSPGTSLSTTVNSPGGQVVLLANQFSVAGTHIVVPKPGRRVWL